MSVCKADPWQVKNNSSKPENGNTDVIEKFEDNFNPNKSESRRTSDIVYSKTESNASGSQRIEPLPDSANYLQLLERKLEKVQKGNKLLDSLQEKKEDCMRSLLASNGVPESTLEQLLDFDTPIESGRLHRHLLPVQAVTVGETLQIVQYDALEEQEQQVEQGQQEKQQDETEK
ncbi:uncharacterized protein [Drosophila virilis]|uniref:Uncharacterized protein n=1 Tax=Drosophila virilis TaxID=7244 RepID=B4MB96_DROVI|nr:uncharacterized protein Dvir_GJ14391 [Drosophila virilis]